MKKLNLLEKFLLGVNKIIKSDETGELENLVRTVAVGIWADSEIKDEEIKEADRIIESVVRHKKDAELVKKLVSDRLNTYAQKNWVYQQERNACLSFIIENKEWSYAEYMVKIFRADKIITSEEDEIAQHLQNLLEAKRYFEAKLGVSF